MSLSNFFKINLPYGISKNSKGEWAAFNREYMPLGWNTVDDNFSIYPNDSQNKNTIYTKYRSLSEKILLEIAGSENNLKRDENGKIQMLFLYNDKTNPSNNSKYWDEYINKIKKLSTIKIG